MIAQLMIFGCFIVVSTGEVILKAEASMPGLRIITFLQIPQYGYQLEMYVYDIVFIIYLEKIL